MANGNSSMVCGGMGDDEASPDQQLAEQASGSCSSLARRKPHCQRWPDNRMRNTKKIFPKRLVAVFVGAVAGYMLDGILFLFAFLRIGYVAQLRFGGSDPQIDSVYPSIGVMTIHALSLIIAVITGSMGLWLISHKKEPTRGFAWCGVALGIVAGTLISDPGYCLMK